MRYELIEIDSFSIAITYHDENSSLLNEAKHKGEPLIGTYSYNKHQPHSPVGIIIYMYMMAQIRYLRLTGMERRMMVIMELKCQIKFIRSLLKGFLDGLFLQVR